MKKTITILFSLLLTSLSTYADDYSDIIEVLKYVETGNRPSLKGDGGTSYGVLQIQWACVQDVNRYWDKDYSHDDMFDPSMAEEVAILYMKMGAELYRKKFGVEPSEETLVRNHNGGIYQGYRINATKKYYSRYLEWKDRLKVEPKTELYDEVEDQGLFEADKDQGEIPRLGDLCEYDGKSFVQRGDERSGNGKDIGNGQYQSVEDHNGTKRFQYEVSVEQRNGPRYYEEPKNSLLRTDYDTKTEEYREHHHLGVRYTCHIDGNYLQAPIFQRILHFHSLFIGQNNGGTVKVIKVRIKKVHKKWEDLFPLGETFDLITGGGEPVLILSKEGQHYYADDLCKCFSNHCSFSDIFDKVEQDDQNVPSIGEQ